MIWIFSCLRFPPRRCALNFGSTFSAWPIGLGVAGRVATVDLNLIRQIWEIDLYYNWKGFPLLPGLFTLSK